ncbi:hypothetical protein Tco_0151716 [Tanacetum coccineum]
MQMEILLEHNIKQTQGRSSRSEGYLKMVGEVPDSRASRKIQGPQLKNFKKDATLKLFKNGMSMSVQKSQVHKMAKLQDGEEIMLG